MKTKSFRSFFLLAVAVVSFLASSQIAQADDSSSSGRYKILSTPSGQYTETYMLDKQTGRLWMLRGQVSEAPFLIAVIYQMMNGNTALSPLDEGAQAETTEDRFVIKSATGSQYAETYVLDKQTGRVWTMRGQVSKGPYLIPCVYQLSSINTALSPLNGASASNPPKDRFSLTCVSSGNYPETYVNDIQAGGIWKIRGQVSKAPFLIPIVYRLVNGETASSPMEGHSEIRLLTKPATALDPQGIFDNTAQTPPTPEGKLDPAVQKKLDDIEKKADEDIKKLFPQDGKQ